LASCYVALMGFSAGSALRFGWETFKRRPWFFVGATFVILLVSLLIDALTSGIDAAFTGSAEQTSILGFVVNIALGTLLSMGATAFYLVAHDNPDTADLTLLWHPQPFLKYLGMYILVALVIGIGLILLIVPGIIFALMFMFAPFIVIERELGPIDAMSESSRITRGHRWPLLGLLGLLILINVAGLLALVVGLLVSIPVSTLALVHAYRVLSGEAGPRPADAALAA
jgi:uncharacterized membrane protein